MKVSKRKLIAIVGPTASGKTAVAIELAKKFNGEIVSADSRQVYRGLDIGTAKEGRPCRPVKSRKLKVEGVEDLRKCLRCVDEIPQWMIDIADPEQKFTLFDYLPLARAAIEDIFSRGKLPIIVGGTGLYIRALTEGFRLEQNLGSRIMNHAVIPAKAGIQKKNELDSGSQATVRNDEYSREHLSELTVKELREVLEELDAEAFLKVDQNNPHRLIRAIEKAQSGEVVTKKKPDFEVLQVALDWPREELYKRIDQRVDERFNQGMLEETIELLKSGVDSEWLLGLGLEYRHMTRFILSCHPELVSGSKCDRIPDQVRNDACFEQMKQELKYKSHQYAKRQLTWFRRFPEIVWLKNSSDAIRKANQFLEDK